MSKKTKPLSNDKSAAATRSFWFDKLSTPKKDLVCIVIMYVIIVLVFHEIIFNNMIFSDSGDTASAHAWFKAMEHIDQTEHVEPLWIPYLFSGMPIFGALIFPREVNYIHAYIIQPIAKVLFFGIDMHWMIMPYLVIGVSMFLLARQLKFSQLASLIAVLTFMLNPYAVGLPETGHGSKLIVLSYIPLLFLFTYNLFERRNVLSVGLLAATVSTMMLNRHPQMAFYGLLVIGCYLLYEIILDAKRQPLMAVKKIALFAAALIIGLVIYAYQYLPTQEYAQYSIRGGGETGVTGGLSYDYATNWSFHPLEMMNLVIPSFMGIVPRADNWMEANAYWGWMPFTNSTLYIGIVPLFLTIIALIYRRNRVTWFFALLSMILFLLSFGKHFGLLYDLMFRYFPFFNKFRTPVMVLHLIPFTFGILAAYGFTFFSETLQLAKEPDRLRLRKQLTNVLMAIGAVLLVGIILNDTVYSFLSGFLFRKDGEMQTLRQAYGQQAAQALAQLKKLRFDLLWKDYIKFAFIAGATLGLIITYLKRKLQLTTFAVGLIAILIIDLAILDEKYINPKPNTAITEHFQSDPTIEKLQADSGLFRVFPTGQLDEDNRMMYHLLPSVEGYSPAKLKIYQEVRDSCFARGNLKVFNMLNVKYIIGQQQAQDGSIQTVSRFNPDYLPRAWFVDSVVVSRSKTETFAILNSPTWDPRKVAILEKQLPSQLSRSDSPSVVISSYASRQITLKTHSKGASLLVLSEIYCPAGWTCTIDGVGTEIYKTNHILRSVLVPGGEHVVEYRFDPSTYNLGYTVTQGAWGVTLVLVLIGVMRHPRVMQKVGRKKERQAENSAGSLLES